MLAGENPESRSHPDATRDVWEIAVWDPTPLCLRLFCLFSPCHIMVYWLFLPAAPGDPRPSLTIITIILLAGLLSVQQTIFQRCFTQQSKDTSVVHKEVLNEYDIKYVHPRTRPLVRDVGIQHPATDINGEGSPYPERESEAVDTYTPTVLVNRGFHTRPNPNYVRHVDAEGLSRSMSPSKGISISKSQLLKTPAGLRDGSSPLRPYTAIRQPNFLDRRTGDGGNLGVYSHANSPLRKAASTNFVEIGHDRERSMSPVKREASMMKSSLLELRNGQPWNHKQETSARRQSGRL
jgi:hypothetical protein